MHIMQAFCGAVTTVTAKLRVYMMRDLLKLESRILQLGSDCQFKLQGCNTDNIVLVDYKVLPLCFLPANN